MMVRLGLIESLTEKCSHAFPEHSRTLEGNRDGWISENAEEIEQAVAAFSTLPDSGKTALESLRNSTTEIAATYFDQMNERGVAKEACLRIVTTLGKANTSGRIDATNLNNARGMYWAQIISERETATQCGIRAPQLKPQIELARTTWRERDEKIIAKIEANPPFEEPSRSQLEAEGLRAAKSRVESAFAAGIGEQYCLRYFNDLGSGANRNNTPKMYAILENAHNGD